MNDRAKGHTKEIPEAVMRELMKLRIRVSALERENEGLKQENRELVALCSRQQMLLRSE